MRIFQRNLENFAENIRKFTAKFQKICPKKPGTLNRSGGNTRIANETLSKLLNEMTN